MFNNIKIIAQMALKNAIRNKFIYFFLFISIVLIFLTTFLSFFNLGAQVKLLIDISLTVILFFALFLAIFITTSDIYNDLKNKIIYSILTKTVTRAQYVIGKFFGFALIEFLIVLFLGLETLILVYFMEGGFNFYLLTAIFYIYIEMLILTAITLLFSLFFPLSITVSITALVFFAGHAKLTIMFNLLDRIMLSNQLSAYLIETIMSILPNLEVFNFRLVATNSLTIPGSYYLKSFVYGLLFIYSTLLIAILFFDKKDIK